MGKNANKLPIYGLFVSGLIWNFMILQGNEYCISCEDKVTDEELFNIFKMFKNLKSIIKAELP
jgi:hypothetical protein